jgi:hypothetical protein
MGLSSSDRYEVLRLLPAPLDDRHNLQYRIKKRGSDVERVASESQLTMISNLVDISGVSAGLTLRGTKKRRYT